METNHKEKYVLAVYDVSGIQEYIFATNRLTENIGASRIVSRVLKEDLNQAIQRIGEHKKVLTEWNPLKSQQALQFQMLRDQDVFVELIYVGGGNAVVAYKDKKTYNDVSRQLARMFIEVSSTLTLVTAFIETDFSSYQEDRKKLGQALAKAKLRIPRYCEISGYSIVEQEVSYGLPVASRYQDKDISLTQRQKQDAAMEDQRNQTQELMGLPAGISFTNRMEELVDAQGKDSYVAVIHIDGNGMREGIVRALESCGSDYGEDILKHRRLSARIAEIYETVYREMIRWLCNHRHDILIQKGENQILPVRRIVGDGDDLTFVCKASLGIPLAALFLRLLLQQKDKPFALTACAGIALVHNHFPMYVAYEIAESCCSNAKKQWYQNQRKNKEECGWLDYHLVRGAYVRQFDEIRQSRFAYGLEVTELSCKPYMVAQKTDQTDDHRFEWLDTVVKHLNEKTEDGVEKWPRNRLKRLYQALSGDKAAAGLLEKEYRSRGFDLNELSEGKPFHALYDALELMDLYDGGIFLKYDLSKEGDS